MSMDFPVDKDLEKVVAGVKDVLSAKVVKDEQGSIREVRVVTEGEKSAQRVARDITSAIRAQGEDVLISDIHVAQVTRGEWNNIVGERLRLNGLSYRTHGMSLECSVTLEYAGRVVTGTSNCTASHAESLRVAARATLDAISCCLPRFPKITLEGVSISVVGGVKVCTVVLSVLEKGSTQHLTGCSQVKSDARDAVCRATLAACNRRLALLLRENRM